MSNVARIVLLFSILLIPNVGQGTKPAKPEESVERPRERGLLVAVLCVFLLLFFLLAAGFCIIHCKLMSQINCDEEDELECLEEGMEECDDSEWWQPAEEEELEPLSTEPPDAKSSQVCITHLYRSESSESLLCDKARADYSLEDFQSYTGSSLTVSQDSLDCQGTDGEDGRGGHSSDSTLFFEICHEM